MSNNNERWNVERIAAYLELSPKHTREAITKKPTFPKPVVNMSRRTRFWLADDVRQWASEAH